MEGEGRLEEEMRRKRLEEEKSALLRADIDEQTDGQIDDSL